jgi:hypothetical protein
MEERTDHERFREIIGGIIAGRRMYHPDFELENWIYECFESEERFVELFPKPLARIEMMERLEERSAEEMHQLRLSLAHIINHGIRKQDIAALRYKETLPLEDSAATMERWETEDEHS